MTETAIETGKVFADGLISVGVMWYLLKWMTNNVVAEIRAGFQRISLSVGRYLVDNTEDLIDIVAKYMWCASIEKLDFIRQRLEKNNLKERQDQIKKQLRTELERLSYGGYIKPLNKYNTKIGLLGDWIADNFAMDEFMEEVYDVVFSDDIIDKKINDIKTIMRSYQSEMFALLKDLLNK